MQDLEQEISEVLAAEIAAEIDFSIIAEMLKSMGWVEIKFNPTMEAELVQEIKQWLEVNCKGQRHSHGNLFLFEDSRDAVNFTLKWL